VIGLAVRVLVALIAAIVAIIGGVTLTGTSDGTVDSATGIAAGANGVALIVVVGILVGVVAYAVVELLQTGAVESVARGFGTRTIVLMPAAIAIDIVLGQTVGTALKVPIYLDSIGTILVGALAGPIPGLLTGVLANLIWTFGLTGTPFGSPYAWPFAIVAAEIGLMAGVFGYLGVFRSRPDTPAPRLVAGAIVAVVVLCALAWWGVLPAYTRGVTFFGDLSSVSPVFVVVAWLIVAILVLAVIVMLVELFRQRNLGVAWIVVGGATCGVVSAVVSAPIAAYAFGGVTGGGTDFLVGAFQKAGSSLTDAVLQQGLISDPIDKTITFVIVFAILQALPRRVAVRFPQGERAVGMREG
jgi:energy-coupling factor transport system substrate-specific component